MKAIYDFKRWALMEEMSLRHKSREIWLKEGDKKHVFSYDGEFTQEAQPYKKNENQWCLV